jgi:hypothetical protein
MHNLSIIQALDIWTDLIHAYYGKNLFGKDTAEIYAYRLLPYSPRKIEDVEEFQCQAAQSLTHLLQLFCESHDCMAHVQHSGSAVTGTVRIPGGSVAPFSHRVHVRIERSK